MSGTLYDRLGGADAIRVVTAEFYSRVMADPMLAPHFAGVDMVRQQGMLAAFLTLATGGPDDYTERGLREAHAGLDIGDAEFDAVVTLLAGVLADAGAGGDLIGEVAAVAETVRGDVLGGELR